MNQAPSGDVEGMVIPKLFTHICVPSANRTYSPFELLLREIIDPLSMLPTTSANAALFNVLSVAAAFAMLRARLALQWTMS